jgi:FkbM family methyltransferase
MNLPTERPRISSSVKRWLVQLIRPPADFLRRYLIGHVDQRLETLQWLHPKLDALHAKLDALHAKADAALEGIRRNSQLIESVRTEASRTAEAIFTKVNLVQSGMEYLGIRARVPIKIDEATYALRTADGFVLVPQSDPLLLIMLHDAGPEGLEPGTRRVLTRLLLPGMVYVDVGAHVGILTLAGARRVGPGGKVIAFEPTPIAFNLLTRTLLLNSLNWACAYCNACGSREEQRTLHIGTVLGHSSLFQLEESSAAARNTDGLETSVNVQVLALDNFFPFGERVDVVKIDVEGSEIEVLTGMKRVISDNPEIVIIAEFGPSHLKRAGFDSRSWFQAFEAHGFAAFTIEELSGACKPALVDELVGVNSINIAFVRPNSNAHDRLLS